MNGTDLEALASRRQWLGLLGGCSAIFLLTGGDARAAGQNPPRPSRSEPVPPGSNDDEDPKLPPPSNGTLQANDKDIKKSVEKLFQLASELKAEVDKTNSAQVLSLPMLRKAEEIEKLAKEIKIRARG
jgi:hypothetical protein